MKQAAVVKLLGLLGAENVQTVKRPGWVISRCPLGPWRHTDGVSGSEVFGVRVVEGDPDCHCFSCDWHGTAGDLVVTMRHLNKQNPALDANWSEAFRIVEEAENQAELDLDFPDLEEMFAAGTKDLHVYPEWWLDSFTPWRDAPFAVEYLASRRGSPELFDELDLRADTVQRRVCFPVRDFQKRLVGLHGRAVDKETLPRYRMYTQAKRNNPIVWLGEHWVDTTKPIVVVEGPFDITAVKMVYPNVVSPLFANPSQDKILRMADCLEWITLYDKGAAGDGGRDKVTKVLHKDHVVHHIMPPSGRKDPGECTPEEIRSLLKGLVPT